MKRGSRRHGSGEWTICRITQLETANLLPPVSRVQASGARSGLVWSCQATRLGIGALGHWTRERQTLPPHRGWGGQGANSAMGDNHVIVGKWAFAAALVDLLRHEA
jgi:hypothetical protein